VFYQSPYANGTDRIVTSAPDTQLVRDMTLQFRYSVDLDTPNGTYTYGVQISLDLADWITHWSHPMITDVPATLYNLPVSPDNGSEPTTYFAFFFTGMNSSS
jgi:hypothetical protein